MARVRNIAIFVALVSTSVCAASAAVVFAGSRKLV